MKFQKLVIHNIASIEDAEIDFSKAPLADSDVFLITGETGSGKSTILDAICLALYNGTPRLRNTKMEGAVEDAGKEVQVNSALQLLRENTGEGFVRLTFEGSNGIPYEAAWSISRARNNPTGRLQPKKWTLKDLQSGITCTKDAEIEAEIGRAVRLTFEQFCRTTMLAQGEFTRFLNSKDEEKAEILEMITGADIYSKIGARVYERCQEKRKEYEDARDAVAGITLLTLEQKEEKTQAIDALHKKVQEAITTRDQFKAKAKWLETESDLSARVVDAGKVLAEVEEAVSSEEFIQEKALVDSWKETRDVRRALETEATETRKAERAGQAIDLLTGDYRRARSGLMFLKGRDEAIQTGLAGVEAILEKEKPDLPVIEKEQAVESQLGIINAGYRMIGKWNGEIVEVEKRLNDVLVPGKDAAKGKLEEVRTARKKAAEALQTAETTLSQAGLPAIRAEITSLTEERGNVQIARDRIANYVAAMNAYNKEEESILAAEKELAGKRTARETLSKEVSELAEKATQARTIYETQSMATNNAVTAIRSRLNVGCTCPVCMQTISSALPTDREIAEKLQPLRVKSDAAKVRHEEAKQKLDILDATILAEGNQLTQRKDAQWEDTTITTCYNAVMAALRPCGIQVYDTGTDASLKERLDAIGDRLLQLSTLEEQGKGLEKAAQDARIADADAAKALETAQTAFVTAEKLVTDASAELGQTRALVEARKKDVVAAEEAVDAIVKGTRWALGWKERRDEFRRDLSEAVSAHKEAVGKRDSLQKEMREVSATVTSVLGILTEIENLAPAWKALEALPAEEHSRIEEAARGLKDRLLVERHNENTAREAAKEAASAVDAFLNGNGGYDRDALSKLSAVPQAEIDGHEAHLQKLGDALVAAKATVETLNVQMATHAAQKPQFEEGETLERLKEKETECDNEVLKYNSEATILEQDLKQDDVNASKVGTLAAKEESCREVWVKWNRLNDLLGDATGKRFRKIAQSYVLGSLVTAANRYMRELTDRYALKVVPGTFIISVEDAYQGYASRPASTISGGESFLVSLSLALALSDIGDTLSVDTLFIDEGFGTLSGAPLQNAVNTLKSLRTKAGRHVGIISHIEELQEKIPVRIQVEKSERTSSSTVRVVP